MASPIFLTKEWESHGEKRLDVESDFEWSTDTPITKVINLLNVLMQILTLN